MIEVGHPRPDTQRTSADLDQLHAALGYYALSYLDIQKVRIAVGNRAKGFERDKLPEDFITHVSQPVDGIEAVEKKLLAELVTYAKRHPMAPWVESVHGFGYVTFALLMGVTGSLERFATVSKLWKYLGLSVNDGHAPKRVKGVPWTHTDCTFGHLEKCKPNCKTNHHKNCVPGGIGNAYSPLGRVVAALYIGENGIVKQRLSPYRRVYDDRRAVILARPRIGPSGCPFGHTHTASADEGGKVYQCVKTTAEGETSAHVHNDARRVAAKALIRDLWCAWHGRESIGSPLY